MSKVKATVKGLIVSSQPLNLKTTEANLMKLHRKIKYSEKVCHIQDLYCHSQGQTGVCQGF